MDMNKITKKDLIEGIGFILMIVGIIGLMCVLYEVNELKGLMKGASNFRSITIRK
jgi:hypothetical protein